MTHWIDITGHALLSTSAEFREQTVQQGVKHLKMVDVQDPTTELHFVGIIENMPRGTGIAVTIDKSSNVKNLVGMLIFRILAAPESFDCLSLSSHGSRVRLYIDVDSPT